MWKESFKRAFRFLFENPVVFLTILGNYALVFLLGPFLGFIGFFFIAALYLAGLHGRGELIEDLKRYARWAFFVAIVQYLLYFGLSLLSWLVYRYLGLDLYAKTAETLIFTLLYSGVLAAIVHPILIALYASTGLSEFKENLKRAALAFKAARGAFFLLWGFILVTLLAGLVKLFHLTVGLYSVLATFWLTYYTFLGVLSFKRALKGG